MSVTRRQHYVWRHHLSAWEMHGRICVVKRNGHSFVTNSANVAVERDFYRLPYLELEDETFVQSFISEAMDRDLPRDIANGWLDAFAAPSRLRRELIRRGVSTSAAEALLAETEIQMEEGLHSRIEGNSVLLLSGLRGDKSDFWGDDDFARDFSFFLALQYFRTKKIRDSVIASFDANPIQGIVSRTFPIFRLVFASNVGWSIFSERRDWRLRLLGASESTKFVTSDQPVINLLSGGDHNDLALFYPISPDRAALLHHSTKNGIVPDEDELSEKIVSGLNHKMATHCYEQLFGSDLDYLKSLAV